MREILFRGKRTDNGEWVEGSLVYWPGDNQIGTIVCFEEEDEAGFVIGTHIEVDLSTVGQFTSLTDNNGRKIFEGDIIRDPYGRTKAVEFYNGRYYPFIAFPDFNCWNERECLVIGNIHDNPELLEV